MASRLIDSDRMALSSEDTDSTRSVGEARQVKYVRFEEQPHLVEARHHPPPRPRTPAPFESCEKTHLHTEQCDYCQLMPGSFFTDSSSADSDYFSSNYFSGVLDDETEIDEGQPLLLNRLLPGMRYVDDDDINTRTITVVLLCVLGTIMIIQVVLLFDSMAKGVMSFLFNEG